MKKTRSFLFLAFFSISLFIPVFADDELTPGKVESNKGAINYGEIFDRDFTSSEMGGLSKSSRSGSPLHTLQENASSDISLPASQSSLSAVNPERYFLAPGDALSIEMWIPGHKRFNASISPLGTLMVPSIGEVQVQGILLKNLSSHLDAVLRKYYRHVRVSGNLVSTRTVKVQVLGEVKQPGAYELSGFLGALDAVGKAGGLTEKSSLRKIDLLKNGQKGQALDYFKWRAFGDETQNPYLEPNEVIYVSVAKNKISIGGEVRRPGSYEFLPGETFEDLIQMAGGYTPEAMVSELKISRISQSRSDLHLTASEKLPLQDGDSVYVPPLSLFQHKIKVIGEIAGVTSLTAKSTLSPELTRIGWYHLHENEKVRDVILNLGGFTPRADSALSRIERKNSDGSTVVIPVNLQKLFTDNDAVQNVALKDGDTLIVPATADSIYVLGEVSRPGVFPYSPNNRIREYLALAGGPASHANLKHAKLLRTPQGTTRPEVIGVNLNSLLKGDQSQENLLLEPGDVVFVPRSEIVGLSDIVNLLGSYAIVKTLFFR